MDMKKVGPQPLDAGVANRLLDLLSTDDAFRSRFVADAKAALEEAGYVAPSNDADYAHPGVCFVVTGLASKTDIAAARERLLGAMTSVPFQFRPPSDLQSD